MLETSAQIVDALRIRLGVETDSAVAAALGVNHTSVVHWRAGRVAMSPEVAVKAAELLGIEPGPLVLTCLAETEHTRKPSIASLYRQLAARLRARPGRPQRARKVAAVLTLAFGATTLMGAPAPSQAATGPVSSAGPVIHYANYRGRRGWRRRRAARTVTYARA